MVMSIFSRALIFLLIGLPVGIAAAQDALRYVPAPVDNPLKGLVPYANPARIVFHTVWNSAT